MLQVFLDSVLSNGGFLYRQRKVRKDIGVSYLVPDRATYSQRNNYSAVNNEPESGIH